MITLSKHFNKKRRLFSNIYFLNWLSLIAAFEFNVFCFRLANSNDLQILASRRVAAAAAAAVNAHTYQPTEFHPGPHPSSEFHPAYRMMPSYVDHLTYLQHAYAHGPPPAPAPTTDFHFALSGSNSGSRLRKRTLSSSPYSDSFDINSMIRFSPNSLAATRTPANGNYGHLAAGGLPHLIGLIHPAHSGTFIGHTVSYYFISILSIFVHL